MTDQATVLNDTDATVDTTSNQTNPTHWELVKRFGGMIVDFVVGFSAITFKAFFVMSIIAAATWFFIGRTYVQDVTKSYLEAELSSGTKTYDIPTGLISARFTKKYWLFGTPEIAFKSPVVDGTLTAMGEINFEVETEKGPSGDITGIVGLDKAFKSNTSEKYKFTGDGISGGFDVQMIGSEAIISNFELNVNWTLVNK